MIELRHLSKRYQTAQGEIVALEDINLTIRDGEVYGIIGLSGAGKSTLVRCINLLEQPTAGQVVIDGRDITTLNRRSLLRLRRSIGMIFQSFNLLEQRSVLRNVTFPLEVSGVKREAASDRAMELLSLVGLSDRASSYPAQLSGGQKQRMAIARALATNPKYLLCDEATSALDPNTTRSILELLKTINETLGVTIVVITHKTILGYSAMAATIDGTGLGQIAISYGHQRFHPDITWCCVFLTVVIVQVIQELGTWLAHHTDKRYCG